jgi:hypothetical protein
MARAFASFPWKLRLCAAVWIVLLVAWIPAIYVLAPAHGVLSSGSLSIVAAFLAAALGATVVWGGLLGYRRDRRSLILSALVGTSILMGCYVVVTLGPPTTADTAGNDNTAGAGVVLLTIPTLLGMAVLLGTGAILGWLIWRVRTPRTRTH